MNVKFSSWISNHIDENPYVFLTPFFKDYEKYLKDMEVKFPNVEISATPSKSFGKTNDKPAATGFSFGKTEEKTPSRGFSAEKTSSASFSFGSGAKTKEKSTVTRIIDQFERKRYPTKRKDETYQLL